MNINKFFVILCISINVFSLFALTPEQDRAKRFIEALNEEDDNEKLRPNIDKAEKAYKEGPLDVKYQLWGGVTPLLAAVDKQFKTLNARDIVKKFIDAGADVNAKTQNGYSVLWYAEGRANPEIITMLKAKGAIKKP